MTVHGSERPKLLSRSSIITERGLTMRGKECFPAFYGILVNELMPDIKEQGIEMPLVEGEKAASLGENSKTRSSRENCATKQELKQIPCG